MFGRNPKKESWLPAVPLEDTVNNRNEVIEAYRGLELPPKYAILMGSGAIAMLRFKDGTPLPRRAHDLDILLHPEFAKELMDLQTLPNGIRIAESADHTARSPHFTAASLPLQSELLTGHSALDGSPFDRYWQNVELIDGVPIVLPSVIYSRKARPFRTGDDAAIKTRLDLYDIDLLDLMHKDSDR